jgi:hypothetical protein
MAEVAGFSADVFAYATAHSFNRLWGRTLQVFPRSEGELFQGLVPLLLAALAFGSWIGGRHTEAANHSGVSTPVTSNSGPAWRRMLTGVVTVVGVVYGGLLVAQVCLGSISTRIAGLPIRATSPGRTVVIVVASLALLVVLSPRVRRFAAGTWRSPLTFAMAAMVLAWALSLGPRPTSFGRPLGDWGPYVWLQVYVPGFDGLRVPARFATIVALFLAGVGGYGVLVMERWRGFRPTMLAAVCLIFLAESTAAPILLNGTSPLHDVVTPVGRLPQGLESPSVYAAVGALPPNAVLIEFPFGVEDYELRYMFASAVHRRPLLNGYSGGFPVSYVQARAVFGRVLSEPDRGWDLLRTRGVTHAVVHEDVFRGGDGARVSAWLTGRGAFLVFHSGGDRLFALPPPAAPATPTPEGGLRHP